MYLERYFSKPVPFFDLEIANLIWAENDKFESNIIPRCLCSLTFATGVLLGEIQTPVIIYAVLLLIIDTIAITSCEFIPGTTGHLLNPIEIAIEKYNCHPSILKIKDNVKNVSSFELRPVTVTTFNEELLRLNPKKHL